MCGGSQGRKVLDASEGLEGGQCVTFVEGGQAQPSPLVEKPLKGINQGRGKAWRACIGRDSAWQELMWMDFSCPIASCISPCKKSFLPPFLYWCSEGWAEPEMCSSIDSLGGGQTPREGALEIWAMGSETISVCSRAPITLWVLRIKYTYFGSSRLEQWKCIWLGTMRLQVQSLASLSGLRIQHCHELWCTLQMWLTSHVAVAVV